MSGTMLDGILERTRADVEARKRERPLPAGEVIEAALPRRAPRRLREALRAPRISVIAEVKRRSPSAGVLRADLDVRALASEYEGGGAAALSVLTDGPHFDGSLADLEAARAACSLPILRKDFVLDSYQLHEAAAAGADAVLLIVAALSAQELATLRSTATALGLDTLVEVHDEVELEVALAVGADMIGVNNRDLRDFSVDVGRTIALLDGMPAGVCVVSESGISTPQQLRELAAAGVSAVLIGESLVRARQPGAALARLLEEAGAGATAAGAVRDAAARPEAAGSEAAGGREAAGSEAAGGREAAGSDAVAGRQAPAS
ncbi:MAG: indole-3-glycerol phosphate synthase TrpC [Solirubrobacteraceae bacterium]